MARWCARWCARCLVVLLSLASDSWKSEERQDRSRFAQTTAKPCVHTLQAHECRIFVSNNYRSTAAHKKDKGNKHGSVHVIHAAAAVLGSSVLLLIHLAWFCSGLSHCSSILVSNPNSTHDKVSAPPLICLSRGSGYLTCLRAGGARRKGR